GIQKGFNLCRIKKVLRPMWIGNGTLNIIRLGNVEHWCGFLNRFRNCVGLLSTEVVEQVRAGDQSQDGESPRTHYSRAVPAARRRGDRMTTRREFITLLGGAAAWPIAARAQQRERMRRIGIIVPASSDDAEYQVRVGALLQELQQLGWIIGRNIRIDTR